MAARQSQKQDAAVPPVDNEPSPCYVCHELGADKSGDKPRRIPCSQCTSSYAHDACLLRSLASRSINYKEFCSAGDGSYDFRCDTCGSMTLHLAVEIKQPSIAQAMIKVLKKWLFVCMVAIARFLFATGLIMVMLSCTVTAGIAIYLGHGHYLDAIASITSDFQCMVACGYAFEGSIILLFYALHLVACNLFLTTSLWWRIGTKIGITAFGVFYSILYKTAQQSLQTTTARLSVQR